MELFSLNVFECGVEALLGQLLHLAGDHAKPVQLLPLDLLHLAGQNGQEVVALSHSS